MLSFEHAQTAAAVAALMERPGCTRLCVLDLPGDEYHKCQALSRSSLVDMLRSPAHFNAARQPDPTATGRPAVPKAHFDYGSLVHTLALQPHRLELEYRVGPEVDTRAAKAWKEALLGTPDGVKLVMPSDVNRAMLQAEVIRANPHFAAHVGRAMWWPEVSCFWRDTVTGQWLMCRPDSMAIIGVPGEPGYGIEVVDLKTTSHAGPVKFASSCAEFHYDAQAAFYSAGITLATELPVQSFLLLASESDWPFVTEAYEIPSDWIGGAAVELRQAIDRYAQCVEHNDWPGYSDGSVQVLQPPWWRAKQIERLSQ